MATNKKIFSSTSCGQVSIQNMNLDGTGIIVLIVAGAMDGTIIKSVTIKATGSTTQGMIRLFAKSGIIAARLILEIPIPAKTQSAVMQAYAITIPTAIIINAGDEIYASTENNETFNVFANANKWENCECV